MVRLEGMEAEAAPVLMPVTVMVRVSLVPTFELAVNSRVIPLAMATQRLVAFLALQERSLRRSHIAGVLWPDTSDDRAAANLRSALWRLKRHSTCLLEAAGSGLRLSAEVEVDYRQIVAAAHELLYSDAEYDVVELRRVGVQTDLLRDWYDDWVVLERERYKQRRLHVIEAMSRAFCRLGRFAAAVEAGQMAVADEPLRESAQRALISAFLAEGNRAEAVKQYDRYRQTLQRELGITPSDTMRHLVAALYKPG